MIHNILFDCDGVLVDSEHLACEVLVAMLRPYGCPVSENELMTRYVGMKDVEIVRQLSEMHHLSLPEDFMKQFELQLDKKLEADLRIIPGMDALVKQLTVPKAIVSNSNLSRLKTSIKTTGITSCFDENKLFTPDVTSFSKPDPQMYQYAIRALGWNPEQTIVVEDSPTGVQAAVGARLKVIGFLGASHTTDNPEQKLLAKGATYIARNSKELGALLTEICV